MIAIDNEFNMTFERIHRMQEQITALRKVEKNPTNYRLSSSGFIAELDRM